MSTNCSGAGSDTTRAVLSWWSLAMMLYPEVQKRAQAELDMVVGPHRPPTFADKPDLPYINALVKECLRFRPVVPLSLVHLSLEEDEYRGYRIPKNSSVVSNPWYVCQLTFPLCAKFSNRILGRMSVTRSSTRIQRRSSLSGS